MGDRVAALDWSATDAGPLDGWPVSLRSAVGLLLRSPVAMVLLWGAAGTMIYNDGYARVAGARHPALLGQPVRDAWPEAVDFNDHVMRVGLAGGNLQYDDEEFTLSRQGVAEQVWFSLAYSPALDDDGKPGGVLAVVAETTARVLANRWQATESERLRELFEAAPTFTTMLRGPDHRYEFANPACYHLLGQRQLVGLPVREALPELEGQGFFELIDHAYATGQAQSGIAAPARLARAGGGELEDRYLDFIMQPVRGANGAVTGIIVQGSDVTDRVLAERAVQESEARYRGFTQAMPNQVWTATPDGMVDWCNDRALADLDATGEELSGRAWVRRVHPDDIASTTRGGTGAAQCHTRAPGCREHR